MLFVFFWTEGMAFWNILERRDLGSIQFYLNFVFCRLSHWSLKTSFLKMRTIHTKLGSYEWLLPALCFHFFRPISRETEKLIKMKSQNFGLNTPNDWSIPQTFPGLTQGFTGWALLQFRTPYLIRSFSHILNCRQHRDVQIWYHEPIVYQSCQREISTCINVSNLLWYDSS